mmetsp:Transcript_8227/g.12635  ORF Transcript_8227/g.12635 Transcript_8227/m.12635 type:complete len:367 (+) Transcript_8227:163-1263(+)
MPTVSAVRLRLDDICRLLCNGNSDLSHLDLTGYGIGDDGAKALGSVIQLQSTLISLSLGYNLISPAGAVPLIESVNNIVHSIDLRCNSIGDEGAFALSKLFMKENKIQHLAIQNNYIGPSGVTVLVSSLGDNATLQSLDLGTNNIGDEGALAIGKLLKTNNSLKVLNLWSNDLTEAGIQVISYGLKENFSVEVLNLGSNSVGDAGAASLAEALEQNSSLRSLHVTNALIREDGAKDLARALIHNRSLTVLDIMHNLIGYKGAEGFCWILRHYNSVIRELRLDYLGQSYEYQRNSSGINEEIIVYLNWNKKGRDETKNVMIPLGSWPNILEKIKEESDLMFLTLLQKPELLRAQSLHAAAEQYLLKC